MPKMKSYLLVTFLVAGAVGLLSCSQQTPPPQSAAPAQPSPSAAAPAAPSTTSVMPAPTGLGTAQYSANPDIYCDLLEVKRVSGNALMVRWRLTNKGTKNITYDFAWESIYYIDPVENKKYSYLTDAEGQRILDVKWGGIGPGDQWLNWAKFPAPPPTSAKISISIGGFAPFEDVPVAQ